MRERKPVAWGCRTCFKFDWADCAEPLADPEHVPYRGVDIGKCPGKMVPLYTDDPVTVELPTEFAVWTEGFNIKGDKGTAQFHGTFKGNTFREAVKAFQYSITPSPGARLIDLDHMTMWGCKFYDNEHDARKLFG